MKIYINRFTGIATSNLKDSSPLQTISVMLGATATLDCVFHDGNTAIELAPEATGVCVGKKAKQYNDLALVQALAWTKLSSADDGYRFVFRPAGQALEALIANEDSVSLMFQVVWNEPDFVGKTQKLSLSVGNSPWRDNEPEIALPGAAWPLPGDWALKSDLSGLNGEIKIGETWFPVQDGRIQPIA